MQLLANPATTSSTTDTNFFYNCKTAIYSAEYNKVTLAYNQLYSDHLASAYDTTNGNVGYNVFATPNSSLTSALLNVILKGNYMVNINNGIRYSCTNDLHSGTVNINNNQIVGYIPSWTGGYCTQAIYAVNNMPSGLPPSTFMASSTATATTTP
jgi:hypothetical protein